MHREIVSRTISTNLVDLTQQTFSYFLRPQINTNFEFSVSDFNTMTSLLSNDIYIVNFYDIYKRLQNTNNVFEVAPNFASIEYQIHVKNTYTLCR